MNYTILIPTKNRPEYLKRLTSFLDKYKLNYVVLDSSEKPKYESNVFYFKPDVNPYLKIKEFLEKVTLSPYVVLCADDYFINPEAIEECVKFLEENKDYSCCHGRYIGFKKENSQFKWRFIYGDEDNDKNTPTFYAVHRTENLKDYFKRIEKAENKELFLNECDRYDGKIRMLPVQYYFKGQEISPNPIKKIWRNVSQDWDTKIPDCNKFDILRNIQINVMGINKIQEEFLKDYKEDD